ncbi:MAG TPA: DUF1080 domain-containing protein [Verrucomicrobiae bacterium]|nr:DUF1080 domain-containing protein [Verrucomicrobiae bacterium]
MKTLSFWAACALPLVCAAQQPVDLFNGKDLSGWVQRGGKATYTIEGNDIVGTSVLNTDNTFLCTGKTYGDFILEYDFKVDPKLNSGVQIRSEYFDTAKEIEWNGKKIKIPAQRVHGYQIEIDPDVPRKRMWSGGIYDEARRGWLFPSDGEQGPQAKTFSEQGLKIFKPNNWNHVRVEAKGDSIKTWLNGTRCADIKDSMTPRGFIALQVHGIGNDKSKEGMQVRWRNLKVTEVASTSSTSPPAAFNVRIVQDGPSDTGSLNTLTVAEKAAGWRLLWDGKSTEGWRSARSDKFPAKGWEIADGVLTVLPSGGGESTGGGDIVTRERYSQFELLVDFRITEGANSGIKYFCEPNLDPITGTGTKAATGSAIGLEYQILDDARHPDAKAGRNGNRTIGSLYDLIPAAATKKVNSPGEWNTARIVVKGKHVEHWLNGEKVVEYERGSKEFRELVAKSKYKSIPNFGELPDGHILLQDHGNRVSFRNIKIRVS